MSRTVALLLAALAAGCHTYPAGGRGAGSGGSGGGEEPRCPPVGYERRCDAFAGAGIERELRCGGLDPGFVEARRLVLSDWSCGGDHPLDAELAALESAGRIRYDDVETGCAVEALRDLACDATPEELDALVARIWWPLEPATPVGEACTEGVQCIDSYCPPRVCGRSCTPFPALGEACGPDVPCGPGAACGYDDRCVAAPALGETCVETCEAPYLCLAPGDGSPNRCYARAAPGERCDRWRSCWTECVDVNPETGIGVCAGQPGAGESCREVIECAPGFACDEGDTFTCVPQLRPGDPCDPEEGWRCYAHPLYTCDRDLARCVTLPGIGEVCDPEDRVGGCRVGTCVDGVCAWVQPPADVPCVEDWTCGDDRICERGRCAEGCR